MGGDAPAAITRAADTLKLYVYIAALIALLTALSGGAVYMHHKGYTAGQVSMRARLDAATKAMDAAQAQSAADDNAVQVVKRQLDANAQAQAQVDARAAKAVNAARANAADADRALKVWMGAYAKALRDPDCQKPSTVLCPALRSY